VRAPSGKEREGTRCYKRNGRRGVAKVEAIGKDAVNYRTGLMGPREQKEKRR